MFALLSKCNIIPQCSKEKHPFNAWNTLSPELLELVGSRMTFFFGPNNFFSPSRVAFDVLMWRETKKIVTVALSKLACSGSLSMTPCLGLIISTLFAAKSAERLERLDARFVCWPHVRRTFFVSVIQHDLEYAALTFTPSMNAGLRNRFLAVWRKAIRCAAGVGYQDEVTPLLSEFRLTNIVDRWIVQFACYVRRCVKQEAPSTSCAKFQWPAHRHRTWAQENPFCPFLAKNCAGLVYFSNRALFLWNSLHGDIREEPSPSSFKRRLLDILKEPCQLRWLGTVLGKTKCAVFFLSKPIVYGTSSIENEIILGVTVLHFLENGSEHCCFWLA